MNLSEETAKELIESFDNLAGELKEFREHFPFGVIPDRKEEVLFNLTKELKKHNDE